MKHSKLNQSGITIAELALVVFMAGMLAVLIGGITTTFYGAVLRSQVEARMVVDSQIILRDIVDELRVASGVIDTSTKTDTYAPVGGWSTDSDNAILIIETPVIASDGSFIQDPNTGEPYKNELIYFAQNREMFRRTLIDETAPENDRFFTCPKEYVGSGGCISADSELSMDYEVMSFVFYDQDDVVTLVTGDARSIDMAINLNRRIFGATVEIENNIRTTLRN